MSYDNIPQFLKDQPKRWLPHKDKLPSVVKTSFNVTQAIPVKWSDQEQWLDYQQALSILQQHHTHLDGLIFLLLPNDNIAVIDIDKYTSLSQATLDNYINPLLQASNSTYIEYSPSGNGLHVWFTYDHNTPFDRLKTPPIELYPGKAHSVMTITGVLFASDTPTDIAYLPSLPALAHALSMALQSQHSISTYDPNTDSYYQRPQEVEEGSRNNALTSYLGALIKKDAINEQALTIDVLVTLAHRFNNKTNKPPLPAQEVERTAKREWQRYAEKDRQEANEQLLQAQNAGSTEHIQSVVGKVTSLQPSILSYMRELHAIPLESLDKDQALVLMIGSMVFVTTQNEFYDVYKNKSYTASAINQSWGAKLSNGHKNQAAATTAWKASKQRKEADDYGWLPLPYPIDPSTTIYQDGIVKLVNTFHYRCDPSSNGSAQPWLDLLDHLIPEPEYRIAVLWYFARMLQKPHIKQNWHPIIFGIQGAGKDSLLAPFNQILPTQVANSNDIRGQYDDHLLGVKLLILNEAKLTKEMVDEYKRLAASDAVNKRTLNIKGKKKVEQQDLVNVVVLSNDPGAVALDRNERRALVLKAPNKMTEGQIAAYYGWLADGGAAYLFHYLLTIDLNDPLFKEITEHKAPYITEYLYNMADMALSEEEYGIQDIMDNYEHDYISEDLLTRLVSNRTGIPLADVAQPVRVYLAGSNEWYQWGVQKGKRPKHVQKWLDDKPFYKKGKAYVRQPELLEIKSVELYDKLDELEQLLKHRLHSRQQEKF
jgi:hypothetical protein